MVSASPLDGTTQRKMHGQGVVTAEKEITLVILNDDMKKYQIIKSQANSIILIDGVSETVKHQIKRQEGQFRGMLLGPLDASVLGNMKQYQVQYFNYEPRFNSFNQEIIYLE